ncbi:MAG: hypothetical protein HY22_14165 [[Candidatus Thermochlorobacteriaceae] bacterium GBChlB]|nr:MAG: hypothetical protein HY22_14165 [[Candidatus Thermochlorobacteriaceae] bacterium GBChlB]
METIGIQTTQNVEISYEIASVSDRVLAALIDYLIIIAYIFSISILLQVLNLSDSFRDDSLFVIVVVLAYAVVLFYDLVCEIFMNGQSFGKKAMKIKVVKLDGTEPSIGAYFLRWVLRIVDSSLFTPAVAVLVVLINGKGQRIGDIAAGTTVVKLTDRVKLSDTIFEAVEQEHVITYNEVSKLNESDIETIKEVLKTVKDADYSTATRLQEKLKTAIMQKMGIANTDQPPKAFLNTVVKDYNAYNGRLS